MLCLWGIAECSGTISLGPVDVTLNFWSVKTQLSNIQKSAYDKQLQQNGRKVAYSSHMISQLDRALMALWPCSDWLK